MMRLSRLAMPGGRVETGLITVVDNILVGMAVAVSAVLARGPPVPTGRSMLASSRELMKDRLPLCSDTVVTVPIRHGHAIREHDGAALRVAFVLRSFLHPLSNGGQTVHGIVKCSLNRSRNTSNLGSSHSSSRKKSTVALATENLAVVVY